MEMVSADYVKSFSRQLEALNESAGKVIFSEEKRLQLTKRLLEGDLESYEDVNRLLHTVCGSYNKLASALTCRFYDGIRQGAKAPGEFNAQQYEQYDKEQITATGRRIAEEVASGRNTVPLANLLSNETSRQMKMANERTMINNARRDPAKPKYCIVAGPGACAWCVMRASNGYQSPKKATVDSHHGCVCAAVQVYPGQKVEGYDPEKYERMYYDAKELLNGDTPKDLQERIDHAKELHEKKQEEAKARGEEVKPWSATNETLIAMRYQQGIK